jgi:tryptophan synthase alpha chain
MNRLEQLFARKQQRILSIYFTAGYPQLNDTATIIDTLAISGVDMIEIGIPFSDPMADGTVIQASSEQALSNGMSLSLLFNQLNDIKHYPNVPLVMMGYLNPILQFGIDDFLNKARVSNIDGVIIPDLPPDVYEKEYKQAFKNAGIKMVFLITSQTSPERIKYVDEQTDGFIYMVTSAGTTGNKNNFNDTHTAYFQKIKNMSLRNPVIAGFGIKDSDGFKTTCNYVQGAIIGSAFINAITPISETLEQRIKNFIKNILQ